MDDEDFGRLEACPPSGPPRVHSACRLTYSHRFKIEAQRFYLESIRGVTILFHVSFWLFLN